MKVRRMEEDFVETDNGVIRQYKENMTEIKRIVEFLYNDELYNTLVDEDTMWIISDMSKSEKGITKLGKIFRIVRDLKNSLEDSSADFNEIYQMVADWSNLRL